MKKRSIGQPLLFQDVKTLQKKIDKYFGDCKKDGRPFTVGGLAYALKTNRQTLLNYEKREQYFDAISRAKQRIQVFAEESLYNKETFKGAQFSLTNNHGWSVKTELDVNVRTALDAQLLQGRQNLRKQLEDDSAAAELEALKRKLDE